MIKKTRLMGALALFPIALASCNNTGGAKLKRVSYDTSVDHCADLSSVIAAYEGAQFSINEVEGESQAFCNLFPSGTVKTNINLKITGGVKIYSSQRVINLPDLDIDFTNDITVSWKKDAGEYIKIANKNDYAYIKPEGTGTSKKYYKYYNSSILGKVKYDITPHVEEDLLTRTTVPAGASFENIAMGQIAFNNGFYYFNRKLNDTDVDFGYSGLGLDISGFDSFGNVLYPGTLLSGKVEAEEGVTIPQAIDKITHSAFEHKYTKKSDGTAVSVNLKLNNYDLKELEKTESNSTIIESSGNLDVDYFLAYENNFIRQHELILRAKDANLFYTSVPEFGLNPIRVIPNIDLSHVNAEIQISQDVIKDECTVDDFKPSEYLLIGDIY